MDVPETRGSCRGSCRWCRTEPFWKRLFVGCWGSKQKTKMLRSELWMACWGLLVGSRLIGEGATTTCMRERGAEWLFRNFSRNYISLGSGIRLASWLLCIKTPPPVGRVRCDRCPPLNHPVRTEARTKKACCLAFLGKGVQETRPAGHEAAIHRSRNFHRRHRCSALSAQSPLSRSVGSAEQMLINGKRGVETEGKTGRGSIRPLGRRTSTSGSVCLSVCLSGFWPPMCDNHQAMMEHQYLNCLYAYLDS